MALTQVTKDFITNIDPNQINSGGATTKDVLNWDGSKWAPNSLTTINNGNFIPTPGTSLTGQVLTFNGSTWVSQGLPNFILNPGATTGQVLTFDGANWTGQGLPSGGVSSSDFTGSNQSLDTNGYQKLPGGLIMQWGVLDTSGSGTATVTFNPPFPNKCFNVVGTQKATSVVTSDIVGIGTITNTSVVFWFSTNADGSGATKLYWQAFGN